MGEYIAVAIAILSVIGVVILIRSKIKEAKGKGCSGCSSSSCENCAYYNNLKNESNENDTENDNKMKRDD